MPNEELSHDRLAEIVATHVDVDPRELYVSRSGTGKFNTTFFGDGGPRPLVLRVAPPDDPDTLLFYEYRMMRQEPTIHAMLLDETTVPVPTILAHEFGTGALGRDYLLMQRMPGTPISDHPGLTRAAFDDILRAVGDCLRQTHARRAETYGYIGQHRPMGPGSDWAGAFHVMWNKLIDDVARCGGYSPAEADSMRRLLDRHARVFDREVPSCLLHMDVWAQNILADDDGRLTSLLDWDRALWGDPEIEFAVLDYCGMGEPAFWEGYGQSRDGSREAEIRRVFYLLYEVQKYIFIRRVRSGSPAGGDDYRRQSLQLAAQIVNIPT